MQTRCQRCGTTAADGQAFCPKCGAVIGMEGGGRAPGEAPPNLAATMVGKKLPTASPAPRVRRPPPAPGAPSAGPRGNNSWLLAVIGLFVVLALGGLLVLLYLLGTS